ncbi:MAG TPA: acetyl-CoA carboxylase carboxyltransferase subunit alpha [Candidatus Dormibacteraeota bacterium]|nr:acetyl-CoA carboxylase carboxyltransferase subunit alpha [Candidatus Dormibacteraeota bacterium]
MNVIVEREKGLLELEQRINDLKAINDQQRALRTGEGAVEGVDFSNEIRMLEEKYASLQREIFGNLTAWQKVHMARHPMRPRSTSYIAALDEFVELHGDRAFRDDPAVIGGMGKLGGRRVMVLAQQKGRDTKENVHRNFGMVHPEGYRKGLRLMRMAEKFGLPIISYIDTSGADPGIGAEERGQSEAIAQCILQLTRVRVPVVASVIGEGGSGGALAFGVADTIIMLEHSIFSIASPEGCAAILWKDAGKAEEAATRLKLTAGDLLALGIIDEIVPEPMGGAHRDAEGTVAALLRAQGRALDALRAMPLERLLAQRYAKYRRIGTWQADGERLVRGVP